MNDSAIAHVLSLSSDPFPSPDYRVCHTPSDLDDYFFGTPRLSARNLPFPNGSERLFLGQDTESTPDSLPYCFTFSHTPGTGRLVYTSDSTLTAYYRDILHEIQPHALFHNYLHDVTVFESLGLPIHTFTDTMVRAYNLCLGGGGDEESESRAGRGSLSLKILAYRHCNLRMTSFKDTVYPHSIPHILTWLKLVSSTFAPSFPQALCICGHPTPLHELRGKTQRPSGPCSLCPCPRHKKATPKSTPEDKLYSLLHRKTNNLITSLANHERPTEWDGPDDPDDDDPYEFIDPWKRIKQWHPHDHQFLYDAGLGDWPKPSIAHVPEKDLVTYAVRDADATLRLFLFMQTHHPWIFY